MIPNDDRSEANGDTCPSVIMRQKNMSCLFSFFTGLIVASSYKLDFTEHPATSTCFVCHLDIHDIGVSIVP